MMAFYSRPIFCGFMYTVTLQVKCEIRINFVQLSENECIPRRNVRNVEKFIKLWLLLKNCDFLKNSFVKYS